MADLVRAALPGQGSTILVVDDMEANRALLSRRLERSDYRVLSADSGLAALRLVAETRPDLILLDYMMPQMSGIEVLRELRADPATRDLPVIMVTARVESSATIDALEAGADDYVTKPIDFEVLRARIEAHLTRTSSAVGLRKANAALDERIARRSLTIADLEEELSKETALREAAEQRLAEHLADGESTPNPAWQAPSDELSEVLGRACERFGFAFETARSGRSPNLAQMAEIKALLERARTMAQGTIDSGRG